MYLQWIGYCSMFNYLWLKNLNKVKFQWGKFVLSLVLGVRPMSFDYPKWFNLPSVKRHNYIKSINIDTKIEMIFGGYDIFMTQINIILISLMISINMLSLVWNKKHRHSKSTYCNNLMERNHCEHASLVFDQISKSNSSPLMSNSLHLMILTHCSYSPNQYWIPSHHIAKKENHDKWLISL